MTILLTILLMILRTTPLTIPRTMILRMTTPLMMTILIIRHIMTSPIGAVGMGIGEIGMVTA